MKPPIIINDSDAIEKPGAIDVFASAGVAERYYEPWYILESHFAFDGAGLALEFIPDGDGLKLRPIAGAAPDPDTVRAYLIAHLKSIATAKGWETVGVDESWCATAGLEELGRKSLEFKTD